MLPSSATPRAHRTAVALTPRDVSSPFRAHARDYSRASTAPGPMMLGGAVPDSPATFDRSAAAAAAAASDRERAQSARDQARENRNNVQVVVRVRPNVAGHQAASAASASAPSCVQTFRSSSGGSIGGGVRLVRDGVDPKTFLFDAVYDDTATQSLLCADIIPTYVKAALDGINGAIMAYGQTGSGKTHTMLGPLSNMHDASSAERGIIPRFLHELFEAIAAKTAERDNVRVEVTCQFLEIYNEALRDLLAPDAGKPASAFSSKESKNTLLIKNQRAGGVKDIHVAGLVPHVVSTYSEALDKLTAGSRNRTTAQTKMNELSSRSHSVFTLHITTSFANSNHKTVSKINLVDLAGSESQKSSGAEGLRLQEAGNINQSLSHLSAYMSFLSTGNNKRSERESKLTHLLSDSIGGTAKTTLIATLNPSASVYAESGNTLAFATTAKKIEVHAKQNVLCDGKVMDVEALRKGLASSLAAEAKAREEARLAREELAALFILGLSDFDERAEGLTEVESHAAELQAQLDETLEINEGLLVLVQERTAELHRVRARNDTLRASASQSSLQQSAVVDALRVQLAEAQAHSDSTQARATQLESAVSALESTLAARDASLAELEDTLATRDSTVSELRSALSEKEDLASNQALRLGQLEADLSQREGSIAQLETSLALAQGNLDAAQASSEQSKANGALLLGDRDARIESLSASLATVRANLASTVARADERESWWLARDARWATKVAESEETVAKSVALAEQLSSCFPAQVEEAQAEDEAKEFVPSVLSYVPDAAPLAFPLIDSENAEDTFRASASKQPFASLRHATPSKSSAAHARSNSVLLTPGSKQPLRAVQNNTPLRQALDGASKTPARVNVLSPPIALAKPRLSAGFSHTWGHVLSENSTAGAAPQPISTPDIEVIGEENSMLSSPLANRMTVARMR